MGHNTCKSMGRVLCVVRRQCEFNAFIVYFHLCVLDVQRVRK